MGNTQEKPPGAGRGGVSGPDRAKGMANGNAEAIPESRRPSVDQSYLDAPAGGLPPHLARMKNEGNHLFKHGQFGDALDKYSQTIDGCTRADSGDPEDLSILYSNRAACHLKVGNSPDCIEDCTKALELQPFSLKALLRRAAAYESLERYRKAYVDYKTVLQIDVEVRAAHDSVHRITRLLIEQDGVEWRQNLPEIPNVPLSVQRAHQGNPASVRRAQERASRDQARRNESRFNTLKLEGNELVKKGLFEDALGHYDQCLALKPEECSLYTNRRPSRTATRLSAWTPTTRKPSTDGRWPTRVYRTTWRLVATYKRSFSWTQTSGRPRRSYWR
ncbi:sperm-associated antigen 1A-like isoform X2 [Stigmatopora argus]